MSAAFDRAVGAELARLAGLSPFEYREVREDAAERLGVGADRRREFRGGARRVIKRIRDTEICDHVQASGQTIAARNLLHGSKWIGIDHGHPSSPCVIHWSRYASSLTIR